MDKTGSVTGNNAISYMDKTVIKMFSRIRCFLYKKKNKQDRNNETVEVWSPITQYLIWI